MNKRFVCIHGHFYQPPRENPWLEAIQMQPSATPYHDWNERVTAECYTANASSRILNEKGLIEEMVNNYAMISFNFGPTLLSWLEHKAPEVYGAVLEADKKSREKFSGHGSAIAQAYNHIIMPLASARDKKTQVLWGIEDFKYRFKRMPEGMWLPETAVDLESLDIMAEQGIKFTILAPHQARRVRAFASGKWLDVRGGSIDTSRPYVLKLSSGRSIAVFFYNGPLSRAVAFEKLLNNGENFALRLAEGLSEDSKRPQLSHIATDGETYGHHHRFGDMALSYALRYIPSTMLAELTNYGEFLEASLPSDEVEINENTSWSCAHGIERWRSDCGCRVGGEQAWNQVWRAPLRQALDHLRDSMAEIFEKKGASLFNDPWKARDAFVRVVLDRSEKNVEAFMAEHLAGTGEKTVTALKLLEMQRNAMLMYTSCGWFFDDLAGIETIQVIQFAARALELAQEVSGIALEEEFLSLLEKAKSNRPGNPDGRRLYEEEIRPSMLSMERVAAHSAITSLFQQKTAMNDLYCYRVTQLDHRIERAGKSVLNTGIMSVKSWITWEERRMVFAALHMGEHNIVCGVKEEPGDKDPKTFISDIAGALLKGNIPQALRIMDGFFDKDGIHSLESLLKDGQNEVLDLLLAPSLKEAESAYRRLYEDNAPLLRYLKVAGIAPPRMLHLAAETVLNASLKRAFEEMDFDEAEIKALLDEADTQGITLDEEVLNYALGKSLVRLGRTLLRDPADRIGLKRLVAAVQLLDLLPFHVNIWDIQNVIYSVMTLHFPTIRDMAEKGEASLLEWVKEFRFLASKLYIAIE